MLCVKTKLLPDKYGGIGLFADQKITKDSIVWVSSSMTCSVYTQTEFDSFPLIYKEFMQRYAYSFSDNEIWINTDDSRFMNHSNNPNVIDLDGVGSDIIMCVANTTIPIGDELTCDYRECDSSYKFCGSFLK